MKPIVPFVFAVSLMMSADTMVLLGNLSGRSGFLGFVFVAAIAYWGMLSPLKQHADSYDAIFIEETRTGTHLESLIHFFSFYTKIIAVVFLTTGLLVSSGFVFNEVFIYWFPNFGFAFLLLIIVTAVQLLPQKLIVYLQVAFTSVAVLGLISLVIAGFIRTEHLLFFVKDWTQNEPIRSAPHVFSISMLLFVGIDMGAMAGKKADFSDKTLYIFLLAAIFFMMILFMLWGRLLIANVPIDRLAQTSIPHILGAKAILGNSGRIIMGAIIIFGSCAAINALYFCIGEQGSRMIGRTLLPDWMKEKRWIIFVLSLISAGLMFGGLAGHRELETFIRGSLILWLLSYSLIMAWDSAQQRILFVKIKNIILLVVLIMSSIILVVTDENTKLMVIFISALFFGLLVIVSFFRIPEAIIFLKHK